MSDIMTIHTVQSQESEIDSTLEDLLGKLIGKGLNAQEEQRYTELVLRRSRLMRPRTLERRRLAGLQQLSI